MRLAPRVLHPATLADLDALPPTWRGEIIDGTLYAFPRPGFVHLDIQGLLLSDLINPYQRGRGGPGGWWIISEPGIRIARAPELSPDLTGWRRERLTWPRREERLSVVPDWVCEVLSDQTGTYDNVVKRRFYAEIGVPFTWYIDPRDKTLRVSKLVDGMWVELGMFGGAEKVRAEPFPEVELNLGEWWEGLGEDEDDEEPEEGEKGE